MWSAVFIAYLILQVLTIRRSTGEGKRRSHLVLLVMLVAITIQSSIERIFENRAANRISILAVGALAVGAIAVLARLIRGQRRAEADAGKGTTEGQIRSMNLS
ncbi:MAG: hypothetical protein ABSE44_08890 [Candidatus Sulfotelmatobacter sp.]